jgi:hypothetical protein
MSTELATDDAPAACAECQDTDVQTVTVNGDPVDLCDDCLYDYILCADAGVVGAEPVGNGAGVES